MDVRLLGPFEARRPPGLVLTRSRRQERLLLALLVLFEGSALSTDRLIDLLWNGEPPRSARGAVHTYVGRLRTQLAGLGVRILTRPGGYLLEADDLRADVHEFRRLTQSAVDAGDPSERVELCRQALELWQGPLLSDLADDALRMRVDGGLAELRLITAERYAESLLEMGEHNRVITELWPLAEQNLSREALVASVMIALYRGGRPAAALGLFRATRSMLVRELGLEPGPRMQTVHRQILRRDPALDRPAAPIYALRIRGQWLPWTVAGHPALEFCNTYAGWGQPEPPAGDWLREYDTLAIWAGHLDLADADTVGSLLAMARQDPVRAERVLDEARRLRRAVYACAVDTADQGAFAIVAQYAQDANRHARFVHGEDGLGRWVLDLSAGLHLPVYGVARSAADLFADPRRHSIRRCPSEDCGWLFLDQAGMRRFCSMATCGKRQGECEPERALAANMV